MAAFMESHRLWKKPVAVEFSFSDNGLGPWPGDMTPFADENRIKGNDLCGAGDTWHQEMLLRMLLSGTTYNAYSTSIGAMATLDGADCWLGKLVAAGIAPQIRGCMFTVFTPAQHKVCDLVIPRVKYWLDKFREFGQASESSIQLLHDDTTPSSLSFAQRHDIFFLALQGGNNNQSMARFSVYVGNTTLAIIPPMPNNSTLIVCQSFGVPFSNLSLPGRGITALTMFAASNVTVFMSGDFWNLNNANMLETVTTAEGTTSRRWVFRAKVDGAQRHTVMLNVREHVSYRVGPGPSLALEPATGHD